MRELDGKVAFVSGGASGIGLAMARAFLGAGMKVMLADIERTALDKAVEELKPRGEVRGTVCDVSHRESLRRAADATVVAFDRVHVVCNNAGVGAGGLQEQIAPADWDWVLGVNLVGVVNGIHAFLPRIKAQGEGGHIVNTASMAGLHAVPTMGPYCASKYAVVALSEGLAAELDGTGIGVSVLCPGWVRTRIAESRRNRPDRFGAVPAPAEPGGAVAAMVTEALRTGMDPARVAARVLAAIRNDQLYVITHPGMRGPVEERFRRILAAFDAAETADAESTATA